MAVLLANNAVSKLASSLTAAATTLSVTSGEGARFPSPNGGDWFPLTLIKASGALEILRCTGRSGDVLTVVRAQEGTAAQSFNAGDRVELRYTKGVHDEQDNSIAAAKSAANNAQATADGAQAAADAAQAAANSAQGEVDALEQLVVIKDAATTTGAALLPAGTNAQRPASPSNGMLRYSTSTNQFEGFQNGQWGQVGGGDPLFSVMWWPQRSAIPSGYVAADGQALSRSTYPEAWAGIQAGNVPTVAESTWQSTATERGKFTAGDGSTTFRLPDYNGKSDGSLGAVFLRGDGALSAAASGVIQRDQMQQITGSFVAQLGMSNSNPTVGAFTHAPDAGDAATPGGSTDQRVTFDSANSPGARTGTETRPLNVTGCWVIKLFGAVVNVGSADAAQLASDYANLAASVSSLQSFVNRFDTPGAAPLYACRAWVNFNGTTSPGAIRASGNVSSVTKNGTGNFVVNFATAMPDTNYACAGYGRWTANTNALLVVTSRLDDVKTVSAFEIRLLTGGASLADPTEVCLSFFR